MGDHVNLPIHHRIERERQCHGTIGYMCGISLDIIHKHLELMDSNIVLLDVHGAIEDPHKTPLNASQFPVLVVFSEEPDPVKANGQIDWKILFDRQIEKAKLVETET